MKSSLLSVLPVAARCLERLFTEAMSWAVVSATPPRTWCIVRGEPKWIMCGGAYGVCDHSGQYCSPALE